jgi:hypothetical protein
MTNRTYSKDTAIAEKIAILNLTFGSTGWSGPLSALALSFPSRTQWEKTQLCI